MKNVDMQIDGDQLTIKIDLGKDFGDSRSGKTIMIASSEGNQTLPGHDDVRLGLNVFKQKPKEKESTKEEESTT